jgi:protease-4
MAADKIYARPTTVTGSIGILGMFPTFQRSLAKIGVHTDGVGTTPLAGSMRLDRAMSPALKRIFEANIRSGYKDFITQVAQYRHMSVDAVDKIGRGRIWSGADAKRIGLVDQLGGLKDAIAEAAKLASLSGGYSVDYISKPLSLSDKFVVDLARDDNNSALASGDLLGSAYVRLLGRFDDSVHTLAHFNDPRGVYAYCMCTIR